MKINNQWFVRRRVQITAAVSASMSFMLAGLCGSWPSSSVPYLLSNASHIHLTPDESSWMVSCLSVGNLIGVASLIYFINFFGRKTILAAVAVPHFISWILIVFGTTVWELYIARILQGVGISVSFVISPLYLAEISEDEIRGLLVTLNQVFCNIGNLMEYSLGPFASFASVGAVSAAFPLVFFLAVIWVPESPYFLLSRGLVDKAEVSLMRLRGADDSTCVKQELNLMHTAVQDALKIKKAPLKALFVKTGSRRALVIVLSLLAVQQLTGHLAVLSYTTQIFQSSSTKMIDPNISVVILGVILFLSSIILSALVDRAGRRPLLIISSGGSTLCMLIVGIYFYIDNKTDIDTSVVSWIPLVSFVTYLPLHSLALGVVPFAIMGEVFPENVKNLAGVLSLMFSSVLSFLVTKLFQIIADGLGIYWPFLIFFIFGFLGTIFIIWYVPETKGKSFIQILKELEAPEYPKRRDIVKQDPS